MNAIKYRDVNSYDFVSNVHEPKISTINEVKIKIIYCGICGSDIHKLLYKKPDMKYMKTEILGHEFVGEIIEKGNNVLEINIGDYVVVEPIICCNSCDMCKKGNIQFCKNINNIGRDIQGAFAEYIVVNKKQCYKLKKRRK